MGISAKNLKEQWHCLKIANVTELLNTSVATGLINDEVIQRRRLFGENKLPEKKKLSSLQIFFNQFKSPLIYILMFAGVVMFLIGEWTDALVIFIAVIVNSIFGFWEERKTTNILDKLNKVLISKTVVLRNSNQVELYQSELVIGDVVLLKAGDKVPADGRVVESNNLKVSEAVLTGEWEAAGKITNTVAEDASLGDRKNMCYAGSLVEKGAGKIVVTATGVYTEAGKIVRLVEETKEEESPLRKRLDEFTRKITMVIGVLSVLIFLGGLARGDNFFKIFETAVAISVGGIPEALPIVMTIVLAIGMDRLLRKRGLVRRLSSVEALGSTNIICFDKTKTLTKGDMVFDSVYSSTEKLAFKIATLCNEAFIENPGSNVGSWKIRGAPTDKALLTAGHGQSIFQPELAKKSKELFHIPFDSKYKYQVSLRQESKDKFIYITGAPDRLLELSNNNEDEWSSKIQELTNKGLRVIGVAYKSYNERSNQLTKSDLRDFTFVGLLSFKDPLRKGIKNTIEVAQRAGLTPIIITGDYARTTVSVADQAGLKVNESEIITGRELDKMSDEELFENVTKYKIYARSAPEHKIRIVKAWQMQSRIVAMIGDGVNDSPALKKADIGVAVGSGTESAKETADIILLDDSFNVIVEAIRQGRVILDNLKKSIAYVLADSFTSVILIGIANIALGWPLPILPVQILWNNIVEDTLPSIAYAFEPPEKNVMKRGPSKVKGALLTKEMKVLIFGTGLIDQFVILVLFWWLWKYLGHDLEYARTMVFAAIAVDTAFVTYSYKNLRKNLWQINPFNNIWLIYSSLFVFVGIAIAIYVPFLQSLLETVSLGVSDWLIVSIVSIVSVSMIELTKFWFIVRHQTEE